MSKKKQRVYGLADFFSGYMDQIGQLTVTNLLFCVPAAVFGGMILLLCQKLPNIFIALIIVPLLSPFTAGLFYVAKRVTLKEPVRAVRDFIKGMKNEWKVFLADALIIYVVTCGIYITMQLYRGNLSSPIMLSSFIMSLLFVLFFVCFQNAFLTMRVMVELSVTAAVKNAVLMFIGGFFNHLKVLFSLALEAFLIYSIIAAIGDVMIAGLVLAVPFLLLLPVLSVYIVVYNVFQTIEKNILTTSAQRQSAAAAVQEPDEEPDLEQLKAYAEGDPEEYVFIDGRMWKRKTIIRMLEEKSV